MSTEAADARPVGFARVKRVEEFADSSKATIRRWVKAGKFPAPAIRDGNVVLWTWESLLEWRANKLREPHDAKNTGQALQAHREKEKEKAREQATTSTEQSAAA
jgi:predicted DNA-binding transcriptional regulator AlpA